MPSVYFAASTGDTFAAILPGFLQDKKTVIMANTAEPIKISGELLIAAFVPIILVVSNAIGVKTAPMP